MNTVTIPICLDTSDTVKKGYIVLRLGVTAVSVYFYLTVEEQDV